MREEIEEDDEDRLVDESNVIENVFFILYIFLYKIYFYFKK